MKMQKNELFHCSCIIFFSFENAHGILCHLLLLWTGVAEKVRPQCGPLTISLDEVETWDDFWRDCGCRPWSIYFSQISNCFWSSFHSSVQTAKYIEAFLNYLIFPQKIPSLPQCLWHWLIKSLWTSRWPYSKWNCLFYILTDYRGYYWKGITIYNSTEFDLH